LFSEAAKLLISAAVAIYLGRRVVTKRPPMPSAYDAAVFNKGLAQTAAGRKFLLKMKSVMLLVVIGILLVLGGIVLGAIRLATPMVHADRDWRELASSSSKSGPSPVVHADRDWRELGALTVIVGSNALFYLVINGVAIRRYKWKWILLTIMLIAPIFANAIIPEPQNGYDLGHLQGFSPVFITLGLVWFLSGAITLAAFMRQNPLPEEQMA
jgi:hypothetical protein